MSKILITGATGNIGTEVVECLSALENKPEVILAVRNIESTKKRHSNLATFNFRQFDF